MRAELSNKPGFITPFIIACGTRNAKFISTAVSCLQRLTVSKSLPKVPPELYSIFASSNAGVVTT